MYVTVYHLLIISWLIFKKVLIYKTFYIFIATLEFEDILEEKEEDREENK